MNPFNPVTKNPETTNKCMMIAIDKFMDAAAKGHFSVMDVQGFWATETHYDPTLSVWEHEKPEEATKIALFLV